MNKKFSPLATTVNTIEPTKADNKFVITKPGVRYATSQRVSAFTTNRNSPRVTSVRGNVKSTNRGLTIAFANPKTIAAIRASTKVLTAKPGTI